MAFEQIGIAAILEDKAFQDGLRRYQQGVNEMQSVSERGASAMSKVWAAGSAAVTVGAAAIVAGVGALAAASKIGLDNLTAWNEQVNTLSDNLGTTGEQSSAWAVAFNRVGVSVDEGSAGLNRFVKGLDDLKNTKPEVTITTAKSAAEIAKLNERLGDAKVKLERAQKALAESKKPTDSMRYAVEDAQKAVNRLNAELGAAQQTVTKTGKAIQASPFQQALDQLGIKAFNAKGKLRSFDEIMPDVLTAFQKMPAGVKKSALAMDLFGRSGTKFLDFLSQGPEGLKRATQLSKLYGLELSTDLSDAIEQFGFALNETNLGLKGFWVTIGKEILPIATKFVNFFNAEILPPLIRFAQWIAPKMAAALDMLFGAFQSVWNIVKLLATGDFTGGIFGFTEDSIFIGALITARNVAIGLFDTLSKGDWAGAWKVVADGAQNLWEIINDQIGDPFVFVQGKLSEAIQAIRDWLAKNGPATWNLAVEWGGKIWNWIKDTAVPALAGKFNELAGGITQWVKDHGPETWDLIVEWAGKIWDWVTTATGLAAEKIFPLMQSATSWLDTNWNSQVKPLLTEWGTKFWDWTKDATLTASVNLAALTQSIKDWAESGDTQQQFQNIGENIGKAIINGITSLFSQSDVSDNTLQTFINSLGESVTNLGESFRSLGEALGGGLVKAIVTALTGDEAKGEFAKGIFRMLSDGILDFVTGGGMFGVARRLIEEFIKAFQKVILEFHLDFSSLFKPSVGGATLPPFQMTPPVPPSQGQPQEQTPMLPIALQVTIDGTEIKNATLQYLSGEIQSIFNTANTQLSAA